MTLLANILLLFCAIVISIASGAGKSADISRAMDRWGDMMSRLRSNAALSQSSVDLMYRDVVSFDPKAFVAASGQKAPLGVGCANPYTVRPGDTLYTIAWRCGATVANLMRWNRLKSAAVRPGQRIIVRLAAPSVPQPGQPAPRPTPRIEPPIRP